MTKRAKTKSSKAGKKTQSATKKPPLRKKPVARRPSSRMPKALREGVASRLLEHLHLSESSVMVATFDRRFRLLEASPSFHAFTEDLFGIRLAVGEVLPDRLAGFDSDRRQLALHMRRALQGEEFFCLMELIGRLDRSKSYEASFTVMPGRDGAIRAVSCLMKELGGSDFLTQIVESSHLQKRVNDVVSSVIYLHDLKMGRDIYVSQQVKDILGVTPQDIFDKTVNPRHGLIHPDDLPLLERQHERLFHSQDNEVCEAELRFRDAHGNYRWLRLRETVFQRETDGSLWQILGSAEDITMARESVGRLASSESRYRQIMQRSHDAIFVADIETGIIVEANAMAETLLGLPLEKIVGMHQSLIHPKEHAEQYRDIFKQHVRMKGCSQVPLTVVRTDGAYIPVNVSASLVEVDGKTYLVGMFRDVSEKERYEEALRESEEKLQQVVQNLDDVFWVLDLRSNEFLYVSPAYQRVWGRNPQTLMHDPLDWLLAVHPEDRERVKNASFNFAGSRGMVEKEYRIVLPGGNVRWILDRAFPVHDDRGQIIRVVGIAHDITDTRVAAESRTKLARLESVGLLAGGIAHDFNNFLAAISANISLARMDGGLSPEIVECLEDALKVCSAAEQVTKQLLTFAKGGLPVKEVLDVAPLLTDATRFALRGSNLICDFNIAPDLAPVEADPGQLRQVIYNLVLNARQAMSGGGRIQVSAVNETANHGVGVGSTFVAIRVVDTGPGIPDEMQGRIFDPYFTTKQGGTGLGLATAYSIIQKHGGFITFDSHPGKGTTFMVLLPVTDKPFKAKKSAPKELLKGSGTILLMDDNEMLLSTNRKALEQLGYHVLTCINGDECIRIYQQRLFDGQRVDLVVLDLTIPGGMGGMETIGQLLLIDPTVRAIVSSGYTSGDTMAEYKRSGFRAILPKPYQITELAQTVREVLEGAA